jgi:beta-galactosidase
MSTVTYDRVAVCLDGKRQFILSGAVHYPRSTPRMWPRILSESRAAGLNTIETYVFWNLHEHRKGRFDFSGRLDLPRFLSECQAQGLKVILRVGPYICAETNFGGLPPWLLQEPGLVTRTNNEPFKRYMAEWCRTLFSRVGEFQATRGGPIVLVQLENEYNNVAKRYGADGKAYMDWVVALAPQVGIEVPLIMCEGASQGAIETLNGFSVAERVPEFKKHNPHMPALWTENWPGWYDTFGFAHHLRDAQELAYNVIRFFAAGGTGVNYYMWHGGTNFGRDAMYLQTTSYDFDGPVDEYGYLSPKGRHLGRLHALLAANAELLLAGAPQANVIEAAQEKETLPRVATVRFAQNARAITFAVNSTKEARSLTVAGVKIELPGESAAVVTENDGKGLLAFESRYGKTAPGRAPSWSPASVRLAFRQFVEPHPDTVPDSQRVMHALPSPVSMLSFTHDLTDYGWYQTTLTRRKAHTARLTLPMVRDFSAVYLNGKFVGMQPERLDEDRPKHWKHEYDLLLKTGKNRLAVLVSAFGLIKGDWMIDAPQSEEKKGLIGEVLVDGKPEPLAWTLDTALWGERMMLYCPYAGQMAKWSAVTAASGRRLRWFRAEFGALKPNAKGYALDVGKLHKGLIWINGRCAGRYWQVPAAAAGADWQHAFIKLSGAGAPTQRYYHLPLEWLKKHNTLVIFEETGAAPAGVKIVERK